ncbi:MAG: aldehyde dehydrogenase family protein, partial [Angustibacter sp.]
MVTTQGARDATSSTDWALAPALSARLAAQVVADHPAQCRTAHAPAYGRPVGLIPQSTAADVRRAVADARRAQRAWAEQPLRRRARAALALHDGILKHQNELLDLIQVENGKARVDAAEEVLDVALVARHYGRRARGYLRTRRRLGVFPGLTRTHQLRQPLGVVGIISPWNYPLTLAVSDALPALLAGNAVVLKPDAQTMFTALRARELLIAAGFPADVFQIVAGDGPSIGGELIDAADFLCFTGSTATGRQVAARCAERLIGCSLELGGKNSMYIASDAQLDRATDGAIRGCFANAGQLCVGTERLILHEDIADEFLDRFLRRVSGLTLGTSLDYRPDLGSLTSARQLATVTEHIRDAVAQGATV